MTAEIAVMNEEAIALAADSAVTGPKIFTSANKIFALSKYHPVAVMVFDSAQFLRVPWETIIKQYRRELARESLPSLRDHADHFLAYFNRANKLFPADAQERATSHYAQILFGGILDDAYGRLELRLESGEQISEEEVAAEVETSIDAEHLRWKEAPERKGLPKSYRQSVAQKYRAQIAAAIAVFDKAELSRGARQRLRAMVPLALSKDERYWRAPQHSGIVIAGFGHDDVFPRLCRFDFETIAADKLKFTEGEPVEIGHEWPAVIVPFAQDEQVRTFMEGVAPQIRSHLDDWWMQKLLEFVGEIGDHVGLEEAARLKLVQQLGPRCAEIVRKDYEGSLQQFQHENNIMPIINIVGMLPKDELAAMAESLVNLTSFKRKVTPEAETVGGPIDVAVISRGDGFIWIKRKHYFTKDLNPQFLANYYRDEEHGGKGK